MTEEKPDLSDLDVEAIADGNLRAVETPGADRKINSLPSALVRMFAIARANARLRNLRRKAYEDARLRSELERIKSRSQNRS